ncbi:MAG: hypothetical protein MJ174_07445 [Treponema sp.]|nr:hypothetical protein [Treponema sp.]
MADTELVKKDEENKKAAQNYVQKTELEKKNDFYNEQEKRMAEANENNVKDAIDKSNVRDRASLYETLKSKGEQEKNIDDGWLQALPKGIYKMYKDGDLGDTSTAKGKKKAKATMGLMIAEEIANSLGKIGNSFAQMGGMNGVYNDRETTAQKINRTNLEQGLQNRWNKIKTSTDNALALVQKEGMSEVEAQKNASFFKQNAMLENSFNRMSDAQKAYAISVKAELGNAISNLDYEQFINLLYGGFASGEDAKSLAGLASVYAVKNPEKTIDGVKKIASDIGGTITDSVSNALPETSTNNVIKFSDGSEIDVGTYATKKDFNKLNAKATELEQKALDNYEDKDALKEVLEDYTKLYNEWQKHTIANKTKTFMTPEAFMDMIGSRKKQYYDDLKTLADVKDKNGKDSKQYKKAKADFDKKYNIK